MTYAGHRRIIDADSHLIELEDFLHLAAEPLGWIIDNVGTDLLVFGSDYPHPEGTSNPIERFEASMKDCEPAAFDAFYYGNMLDVMGG